MARTENKGSAEIRAWEINSNSTRYDYLLAAPSDELLTRYWTTWAIIATAGGLFVAVILCGILSSRDTRKRAFNLFSVYLMIPDVVFSVLCGVVCAIHAANGHQVASLCNFQMVFVVFGVGSNLWLNAAVANQLHAMLQDSFVRRKFKVPTPSAITRQAIGIYLFNLFLASGGLIENEKFPHYAASVSGLACVPIVQDFHSSLFYWIVFFPLFGGIPVTYVFYVSWDIWRKKLLPPAGKRRLLFIYFGRIVFVFLCTWLPFMTTVFVLATWVPSWVQFIGGTLSHLQGVASASLCLLKPDIYFAVKRFVSCQTFTEEERPREDRGSSPLSTFFGRFSPRQLFGVQNDCVVSADLEGRAGAMPPVESVVADESDLALWPKENGEYSSEEQFGPSEEDRN